MILKIHLMISVLAYIFFWLTIYRMINIYKKENKDKKLENNSLGIIDSLRMIVIFLIPLVNIVSLVIYIDMFLFKDDENLLREIAKRL